MGIRLSGMCRISPNDSDRYYSLLKLNHEPPNKKARTVYNILRTHKTEENKGFYPCMA